MITLELYKFTWNTKYLQFNPKKWSLQIRHYQHGVNLEGWSIETGKLEKGYGYFDWIGIRTSPIPTYVSETDIEIWN